MTNLRERDTEKEPNRNHENEMYSKSNKNSVESLSFRVDQVENRPGR